jgi:hypothetical protein
VPDWIKLKGPKKTGQQGLAWDFEVVTDAPGEYYTSVAFECDTGVGRCQISLVLREEPARLGDLVLCDSPFHCCTTHEPLDGLVRILDALPFRVHHLRSLSEFGDLRPRTVLLHQSGLLWCKPEDLASLQRLPATGMNLLILADEFFRGTTGAANRVLRPFGLRFKQDGAEEPGLTREERLQRIVDWQARYEHVPYVAGPDHIAAHPLTAGVKRLHWFRPCPVVCADAAARPLVKNPADVAECFAAVAVPGGYVVALGTSLWFGLSGVGWPYDNDRFLANLLVGGDAEALMAGAGDASGVGPAA